jgi:hypothetical protein
VLDDGLRLWRASIPKTWPLAVLAQLAFALPFSLLAYKFPGAFPVSPMAAAKAANSQAMLALVSSPLTWLTYLAIIIVTMVCYSAITLRIRAVSSDTDLSLGASLAGGLRALPRLLVQLLLIFVCALIAVVVLGFLAGLLGGLLGGARAVTAAFLPLVTLVGCVFLAGRLFLSSMPVILDGGGPAESIAVSWRLTRSYWWRCAAILTVLLIIGLVFTLVVSFVNVSIGAALGAGFLTTILAQVLGVLVNSLLGSIYPAVLTAIFFDLKLRKQGGDLMGRVDALARQ